MIEIHEDYGSNRVGFGHSGHYTPDIVSYVKCGHFCRLPMFRQNACCLCEDQNVFCVVCEWGRG